MNNGENKTQNKTQTKKKKKGSEVVKLNRFQPREQFLDAVCFVLFVLCFFLLFSSEREREVGGGEDEIKDRE